MIVESLLFELDLVGVLMICLLMEKFSLRCDLAGVKSFFFLNCAASEGKTQVANDADTFFFSNLNVPKTIGGKASLQPKRTPVSNEEMEAILVSYFVDMNNTCLKSYPFSNLWLSYYLMDCDQLLSFWTKKVKSEFLFSLCDNFVTFLTSLFLQIFNSWEAASDHSI